VVFSTNLAQGRSGSIAKLTAALLRNKSYKVRLQAAVVLARKKDPRSYAALVQCLQFDSHYLVRALCATALGRLGRTDARKILTKARKDKHKFVRKRAMAALRTLRRNHLPSDARDWSIPPKRRARYYISLGSMASTSRRVHKTYRKRMKQIFWESLQQSKRVTMGLSKDKPPATYLKKYRLKAFVLDAALVKLRSRRRRVSRRRREMSIQAHIKVTLARYPKMNIIMITTGEATASQKYRGRISRKERRMLYHRLKTEAIDSAARSASKNVRKYLKRH
jgi:hypothetical protein